MTIEKEIKAIRTAQKARNKVRYITKEDISETVKCAVETQINGNLRDIKKVQVTQGETLVKITDHLVEQDKTLIRLEEKVRPAVASFDWIMSAGKVIMWISIAIASVGGAVLVIKQLI